MKYVFYYPLLLLIAAACNNEQNTNKTTTDSVVNTVDTVQPPVITPPDVTGCYRRILQRDTLVAKLEQKGDSISGKLTFDNYQKDGSSGVVKGHIEGDIIKLIYSFRSEGMNSVMEVYFKRDGSGITRGIGEMNVKADTARYTNPATIQYPATEKWNRIDCDQLPSKYQ
jgi:hypothetical protein